MHKLNNLTMPFQTRNTRKFSEKLPITDFSCPIKKYMNIFFPHETKMRIHFCFVWKKNLDQWEKKIKIKRSDLNITFTYDHCPN